MNVRFFADHLLALSHPDFETRGHRNHVSWDPAGVTAIVTPWNAPLMLATWRIGPALAAGNTVVAKPPEWAPLTACLFADIAHEAGLPAGRVQRRAGSRHRGRGAARRASRRTTDLLHRLGPDLGARSARRRPATSPRSASSSAASRPCSCSTTPTSTSRSTSRSSSSTTPARSASPPSGSSCRTAIYDEFRTRFLERAAQVTQGDPRDESVGHRPAGRAHAPRPGRRLRAARGRGGSPGARRWWTEHRAQRADRRLLLPAHGVRGSRPVDGDHLPGGVRPGAHASALRHRGRGRGSWPTTPTSAWRPPSSTGDHERAERVASQVRAGTVWVNCFFVRDLSAPFGGSGRSGIGREGGTWSFDFYCDVKNTVFAPTGWS